MSKLKFARDIISAELQHAKQGLAYYEERVQQLESALQQVDSLNGGGKTKAAPKTTEKDARTKKQRGSRPQVKASPSSGRNGAALPKTGVDFWMRHVSKRPKSGVDIANAAAAALQLDPDKDKKLIQVLKSRVAPALQSLVDAKRVQDKGAGRERRFFVA